MSFCVSPSQRACEPVRDRCLGPCSRPGHAAGWRSRNGAPAGWVAWATNAITEGREPTRCHVKVNPVQAEVGATKWVAQSSLSAPPLRDRGFPTGVRVGDLSFGRCGGKVGRLCHNLVRDCENSNKECQTAIARGWGDSGGFHPRLILPAGEGTSLWKSRPPSC